MSDLKHGDDCIHQGAKILENLLSGIHWFSLIIDETTQNLAQNNAHHDLPNKQEQE